MKKPKPLPSPTQEEINHLFQKHADWVKWANTKRDSLLLGFDALCCSQLSWRDVESILFKDDCDKSPYYLAQYSREDLVDLYVCLNQESGYVCLNRTVSKT